MDQGDLELISRRDQDVRDYIDQRVTDMLSADSVRAIVLEELGLFRSEIETRLDTLLAEINRAEAAAEVAEEAAEEAEEAAEEAEEAEETPAEEAEEAVEAEETPAEEAVAENEEIREILGEQDDSPAPDRRGLWRRPILNPR